jgi:hypothetical protein
LVAEEINSIDKVQNVCNSDLDMAAEISSMPCDRLRLRRLCISFGAGFEHFSS